MIRIAIVEDDSMSRKLILEYLARYQHEFHESFDVTVFEDGASIIHGYTPRFDIILLDIQMPHVDGMSAAKKIRTMDDQVSLLFITSSPQYAIKGYEVDASSYLLKPLPWFAFQQELARSIADVRKRRDTSVLLQVGAGVIRLSVADIIYIESIKHRLEVHTLGEMYSIVGTLKNMEEQLESHDFFRSNSCYLVNLAHVRGVRDQACVMTGNVELRISRPRKKQFMTALTNYFSSTR